MSERINLKPCPFCGSQGKFIFRYHNDTDKYLVYVKCKNCHSRTGYVFGNENPSTSRYRDDSSIKCAESWNTRIVNGEN